MIFATIVFRIYHAVFGATTWPVCQGLYLWRFSDLAGVTRAARLSRPLPLLARRSTKHLVQSGVRNSSIALDHPFPFESMTQAEILPENVH